MDSLVPYTDEEIARMRAENTNPDEDNGSPSIHDKNLCECGKPKQVRSRMCWDCWNEQRKHHPRWKGSDRWEKS